MFRKGGDISARLEWLGSVVVRVAGELDESSAERKHVVMQLLRSGTACGANYEEARAAESRADFVHKVSVAAKEARETTFWLRMLQSCGSQVERSSSASSTASGSVAAAELARAINEAEQLAAILAASARTARRNG
ncbi:MAG TPA: four helix bundle protein [Kofleriaceae bacterium]